MHDARGRNRVGVSERRRAAAAAQTCLSFLRRQRPRQTDQSQSGHKSLQHCSVYRRTNGTVCTEKGNHLKRKYFN